MRLVAPAISVLIFVVLIIAYQKERISGATLGALAAVVTIATAVFFFSDSLLNSPETNGGTSATPAGLEPDHTLVPATQEPLTPDPPIKEPPTLQPTVVPPTDSPRTEVPGPNTATPTPTATLTDEESVVQMVRQYYEFIHAGNGEAAYGLLHTELQNSPGFFPYEQWESTVANVEYEFLGAFPRLVEVLGNQARVDFVVRWERSEELPDTRNHTFCFKYRIEEKSWFIRHIHFVFSDCFGLMNPTPAPTP